jgi:DNA polymerase III delta prime subunit
LILIPELDLDIFLRGKMDFKIIKQEFLISSEINMINKEKTKFIDIVNKDEKIIIFLREQVRNIMQSKNRIIFKLKIIEPDQVVKLSGYNFIKTIFYNNNPKLVYLREDSIKELELC